MKRAGFFLVLLLSGGAFLLGSMWADFTASTPARRVASPDAGPAEVLEAVLIHNNRGIALLEQYDYRRAAGEFQKALELKPDFLPGIVNLGIAFYYDSEYQKAAEQFQAALKLDPKQPHAHFMLGLLYSKEYKKEEALREFQTVVDIYPDDSATNYNLGLTHMRAKDYDAAVTYFEKVLQTEPRHFSAMYNLGMALMRAGKREDALKVMTQLRGLKGEDQGGSLMEAMGTQYQDEGRFAIAIGVYDVDVPPADVPAPKVTFVDATERSGIGFIHAAESKTGAKVGGTTEIQPGQYSREWAEGNLVPVFGSGAAFLDYDGDGKLDLYLVNCSADGKAASALYRNRGDGTFADVTGEAGVGLAGRGMGVAVGDYNNDGRADIYVTLYGQNRLFRNDKNGKFTDVTAEAGVGGWEGKWSLSAAFFDYDHDGDLDLYVCNFVDLGNAPTGRSLRFPEDFPAQPNLLYRNNGNGTFSDVAARAAVSDAGSRSTTLIPMDYNESRDIDFCLLGLGAPMRLFSSNRDGSFTDVAERTGLSKFAASSGASSGDLNKDGYPDLYLPAPDGALGGRIMLNQAGRTFREVAVAGAASGVSTTATSWASAVLDYDNDGDLDIFGIGRQPYILRNEGRGNFRDASVECGLHQLDIGAARSLTPGDYDADGDVDILVMRNGGRPVLLRNEGGNQNNYLKVNLAALNDNKSGIGSKVEIRSGALWQRIEVTGGCGYLSQGSTELIFGLGARKTVDAIKILWPTGVLQAELEPKANSLLQVHQVDRKGTSCPILYAWNGSEYAFVTDFLGGSAFGNLLAPGLYNSTDTDEYILVKSSQLRARNGAYSLKMNNQLEEVIFIDQAKLLVIDHPADTEVYPNERLLPAPPFPDYRTFVTRGARPPVSAFDEKGNDVLSAIRNIDRKYPDTFRLLPFKGYAEEHSLVLDLGDTAASNRVVLLMHAWIDYADSTANLAASQASVRLVPPYLQVVDNSGNWVTALKSMGFPAGLPKTMTVDLAGKFVNPRDRRVRIVTNMRIYWDRILVAPYEDETAVLTASLSPSSAVLASGGYPREYSPDGKKPRLYDYSKRARSATWRTHVGAYTRYGDVLELTAAKDNLYVIMRHGDEITLDFDARKLEPLREGWTRSCMVYADGFGKDMDVNSAYPDTLEPLPFHGMPGYPYRGTHAFDGRWKEYNRKYNTRIVPHIYFVNGDLRTHAWPDEASTLRSAGH